MAGNAVFSECTFELQQCVCVLGTPHPDLLKEALDGLMAIELVVSDTQESGGSFSRISKFDRRSVVTALDKQRELATFINQTAVAKIATQGSWVVANKDGVCQCGNKPILIDFSRAITGESEGGKTVAAFTDSDLAEQFAKASGEDSVVAATFENNWYFLAFLESHRNAGTACVAFDSDIGKRFSGELIDKVIKDVRKSLN